MNINVMSVVSICMYINCICVHVTATTVSIKLESEAHETSEFLPVTECACHA